MVYKCAGGRGGAKIATFDLTLAHGGDYKTWQFWWSRTLKMFSEG